eukprot:3005723-Prymnesium_polylepis.1
MREAAPTHSPTARTGGTQPITTIARSIETWLCAPRPYERLSRLWLCDPKPYESSPRLAASAERSGVHRCSRRKSPQR